MRKTIGIVRPAFTAKPLAFPGSHLGMALTSRTASFARDGSTAPTAFMSVIVPSLLTMKLTLTSPCIPFSSATTGYFKLLSRYLLRASSPPGNCGNSVRLSFVNILSRLISFYSIAPDAIAKKSIMIKDFFHILVNYLLFLFLNAWTKSVIAFSRFSFFM